MKNLPQRRRLIIIMFSGVGALIGAGFLLTISSFVPKCLSIAGTLLDPRLVEFTALCGGQVVVGILLSVFVACYDATPRSRRFLLGVASALCLTTFGEILFGKFQGVGIPFVMPNVMLVMALLSGMREPAVTPDASATNAVTPDVGSAGHANNR